METTTDPWTGLEQVHARAEALLDVHAKAEALLDQHRGLTDLIGALWAHIAVEVRESGYRVGRRRVRELLGDGIAPQTIVAALDDPAPSESGLFRVVCGRPAVTLKGRTWQRFLTGRRGPLQRTGLMWSSRKWGAGDHNDWIDLYTEGWFEGIQDAIGYTDPGDESPD